jgi:Alanine-zipper, major outer membrane lipoprotein
MRSRTSVTTWLSLLALPLLVSACASQGAVPTATRAEVNSAAATANQSKSEADQALQTAQKALQTAQKAEDDAQAADQRADKMYDRSLSK